MKIAIQGIQGSFHHIVAENYFGDDIELVECMTFAEMPHLVNSQKADYAIMAIENSIAGAILPNYTLIDENHMTIVGEYYLSIDQNLMALKGQTIEDIEKVYSHPMALHQCRKYFKQYPNIKLIEDADTADVAKRIREQQLKNIGAIASVKAAEIYQLDVLASKIQTIQNNFTRFVIVQKTQQNKHVSPTKASIKFVLKDELGSLGEVLTMLATHKVNLSKIQSLPIMDRPWEYAFFADLIFEDVQEYQNAIEDLNRKVSSLKILGAYKANK